MKKLLWLFILGMFIAGCQPGGGEHRSHTIRNEQPPQGSRRALLIGVTAYDRGQPKTRDWWSLHTESDVHAVRDVLVECFGFKTAHVRLLSTKHQTTAASIRSALNTLVDDTQAGDIVYIHFSGHGNQVLDDNNDEADGLDETLVPSDYVSIQDASRDIRDDELRDLSKRLQAKHPANATMVFDCCHAGTNTRGGRHTVRGREYNSPPPMDRVELGATPEGPSGYFSADAIGNLSCTVISACRDKESAQEVDSDGDGEDDMGLLTFAMVRALRSGSLHAYTNRDLLESISDFVTQKAPSQTPVLEGPRDLVFLSGIIHPRPSYVMVEQHGANTRLKAGLLHGVTTGSEYSVFPQSSTSFDPSQALGTVKIGSVDLSSSEVVVPEDTLKRGSLDLARAVERVHAYGEWGSRVCVEGPLLEDVVSRLRRLSIVNRIGPEGDDWSVRIRHRSVPKGDLTYDADQVDPKLTWMVERDDGSLIQAVSESPQLYGDLKALLEGDARWRAIKALRNTAPESRVSIKIALRGVDVDTAKLDAHGKITGPEAIKRTFPLDPGPAGSITLTDGQYVQIGVLNNGRWQAHVTVLNVTEGGAVSVVFPPPGHQDNQYPPDRGWEWRWEAIVQMSPSPPTWRDNQRGTVELFKAIATSEYIDLASFATPERARGTQVPARHPLSQLAEFLRGAALGQRSPGSTNVTTRDWNADALPVYVRPPS